MNRKILIYSELTKLTTFEERFNYLKLSGNVCEETFGVDRYLNQIFYRSYEWRHIRNLVIVRDNGCDLGVKDHDITGTIIIHHMNPVTIDDVVNRTAILLDPQYLICVSHSTHNAIHYGSDPVIETVAKRTPFDTCPWKKGGNSVR